MPSRRPGPLVRNTIFLYALTVVKLAGPLVTLPYLTRVLSIETYGFVAYVKAYASYVQLFLDFGFLLSATAAVSLLRSRAADIGRIVGDTVVEKLLLAVVAAAGTALAVSLLPILTRDPAFVWLYFASCVASISVLDFLYRGLEKMEYAAAPFILAKAIVVALTFILIRDEGDLLLLPILEIAGNLAAGAVSFMLLRTLDISLGVSGLRRWLRDLWESSVYFISNFATTVFGALTTLVVGVVLNLEDVAFWSIAMMFVATAKALYGPVSNSLYPHMVQSRDISLLHKVAVWSSLPLLAFCGLLFFFGGDIAALVMGAGYHASGDVIRALTPVLFFSYFSMLYGWPALGPIGKAQAATLTTIVAAVVQTIGIAALLACGQFTLLSLAIVCSIVEAGLLLGRYVLVARNRFLFELPNG